MTGSFAPTLRHGSPDDLRPFVDRMHERGIGVILDGDVSMERGVKEIDRFAFGWTAHFALAEQSWRSEKLGKWLPRTVPTAR